MEQTCAPLAPLFEARSVAIVGASENVESLSGKPLVRLRQHNYSGNVVAVNPRHSNLGGYDCVPSVLDLPDGVDVALLMLRADLVAQAVRDCGTRKIPIAVVVSSGFEDNDASGQSPTVQLRAAISESGVRVVGPNCEGIWSIPNDLTLTFGSAADRPKLVEGSVSVISQSGSLGAAVMRELQDREIGCRYFVSSGNEIDFTTMDFCDYMIEEGGSKVITIFIEGLKDGWRLRYVAEKARKHGVDLIILRSGQSELGRVATQSHTGRVATASAVYHDVLQQAGILEVSTLNELIDATQVAAMQSKGLPRLNQVKAPGRGIGIVAISGGSRALLADAGERRGVPLAKFGEATERALTELLPNFAYGRNPVDVTGAVLSSPQLFEDVMRVVAADENVEALVVQYANGGDRQVEGHAGLFDTITQTYNKPVVASLLAGRRIEGATRDHDAFVLTRDPEESIKQLDWLYRLSAPVVAPPKPVPFSPTNGAQPNTWSERSALLDAMKISAPAWRLPTTTQEMDDAVSSLRAPWVVKASPEYSEHKTELGLVHLGLTTREEAMAAMAQIQRLLGAGVPVLVQEMVSGGQEMLLSVRTDPDVGPVMAIGFGGILTEWMNDIAYLCLPTTGDEIRASLGKLRSWTLLNGFRGRAHSDVDALVDAALGMADAYLASYQGWEIEINPILVRAQGEGVQALDVLCASGQGA